MPGAAKLAAISWSSTTSTDRFEREIFLRLGAGDEATRRRLDNLGYAEATASLDDKLTEFRAVFGRDEDLDAVLAELAGWHDGADRPTPREAESPEDVAASPEMPVEDAQEQ